MPCILKIFTPSPLITLSILLMSSHSTLGLYFPLFESSLYCLASLWVALMCCQPTRDHIIVNI